MRPHENLTASMKQAGIDIYIVPTSDAHQMEYLDAHDRTREFLSGFTGSAGTLVVTQDAAYLWTDGRYFLQATKELEGSGISLMKMGEENVPTVEEFVREHGGRVGFDAKTFPLRLYERLEGLERVDIDLVSPLWTNRPDAHRTDAFLVNEGNYARTAKEKLNALRKDLAKTGATATVIGALEDIAWVLNLRARDVRCNPVFTSYLFVDAKRAVLFASEEHLPENVRAALREAEVETMPYDEVFDFMDKISDTVYLDPDRSSTRMRMHITGKVVTGRNLTTLPKAIKDEAEIAAIRRAMHTDGVALVRFLNWLEHHKDKGITEMDVVETLLAYRKKGEGFVEESFETIAGYGPNGAIIHYEPTEASHAKIEPRGLLLLDSGGQYQDGTTDITRTIALGPVTEEQRRVYTLVLKGHIQLELAKFPDGCSGTQIDALAREPLWRAGLNYLHGTGHGVGSYLNVHEGPHQVRMEYMPAALRAGMTVTNEPGIYLSDRFGVRIENTCLIKDYMETELGRFLKMESLTLCPIDLAPVDCSLLTAEEKQWLNDYHQMVCEKLAPHLDGEDLAWLQDHCKPIEA